MKEFLKLIVTVIVIGVIAYTLYFFLTISAEYQDSNISGDIVIDEKESIDIDDSQNEVEKNDKNIFDDEREESLNNNIFRGDKEENLDNNIEKEIENTLETDSGNKMNQTVMNSGDVQQERGNSEINIDDISNIDEEYFNKKISEINMIETKNRLANLTNTIEDSVGIEIIGEKNQDYFDNFSIKEMSVNIQIAGTMIYIIPMPDFVDNAQYHYDENGELALYICELTGIGGEVRYYFDNGKLLTRLENIEEDVIIPSENINEIVNRSKVIYDKYIK